MSPAWRYRGGYPGRQQVVNLEQHGGTAVSARVPRPLLRDGSVRNRRSEPGELRDQRADFDRLWFGEAPDVARAPPEGRWSPVPDCPQCGSLMKLREARTGPNQGNRFWGCSDYPRCRGTLEVGEDAVGESLPDSAGLALGPVRELKREPAQTPVDPLPVSWRAAAPDGFLAEYADIGAWPGILKERLRRDDRLRRAVGQCVLYSSSRRERGGASPHARRVSGVLADLLRRGKTPLVTLGVEASALESNGVLSRVAALDKGKDGIRKQLGWRFRDGVRVSVDSLLPGLIRRCGFALEPTVAFDSDAAERGAGAVRGRVGSAMEQRFLEQWVPAALDPQAGHWFTPQASLDRLVESLGGTNDAGPGARRVDFLFSYPNGRPFVVELDGDEHEASVLVDDDRDKALNGVGLEVVRVGNREVEAGAGPGLARVHRLYFKAVESVSGSTDDAIANVVLDCVEAARVQFAVVRAVQYGWLRGGREWRIELTGSSPVAVAGVRDALEMLAALDTLHGGPCEQAAPTLCRVARDAEEIVWRLGDFDRDPGATVAEQRGGAGTERSVAAPGRDFNEPPQRLAIAVDRFAGPFHDLGRHRDADFVIRAACLPVALASDNDGATDRRPIATETREEAEPALRLFLRHVFRKSDFLEGQALAVFNVLKARDTVVLLPTGGGKSIIYQLAGLLVPGPTLVVDPIIALMEDQVRGLREYGIDRAAELSSGLSQRQQEQVLGRFARGEYVFLLITPERLQSPTFREALKEVTETTQVGLAVVDEAHCVSEWGHDFRPAYLGMARNLRHLGADAAGLPPPVLALTGTASRAVLRDMLLALGIDRHRSDAIVRPESFDRGELRYEIRRAPAGDSEPVLRGLLRRLPADWSWPRAEFFEPRGPETRSGIVFVPHVNGRFGLRRVENLVGRSSGAEVESYSGTAPKDFEGDWEKRKRQNAEAFKSNEVPVLVATKAFGMGIDKPNVRFTVHYGMPPSLESFYQEAGRAGRDRLPARCKVVYTEYDPRRSDHLLDPTAGLEEIRQRYGDVQDRGDAFATRDDVTNALFFHVGAFPGIEVEIESAAQVLREIGDLSARRGVEIPFRGQREPKEKVLYRLARIAVLRDYEVEYGREFFRAEIESFDLERSKRALLAYVEATLPARVPGFARRLEDVEGSDHDCVVSLLGMLIDFTYEQIERSRRRAIQESMLLARQAESDGEIRRRLLDYLSEGFGAERIEALLDEREIDLAEWLALVEKVETAMDAGELRGMGIRFLESYPDHPGLLLVRSIAEAMCSDRDDAVSASGIADAFRIGFETYELPKSVLSETMTLMFEMTNVPVAQDSGLAAARALLSLGDDPVFRWAAERTSELALQSPDERIRDEARAWRLGDLTTQLDQLVAKTMDRWKPASGAAAPDGG